ncbi:MAG: VOC family protein [Clostridium argentinense]|uniref:VOC family protein n=1 Tax=Clostridium faecium TaxID=2762223 RepID=A0ABR8YUG6_9CLOT|nr:MULTISPECIES: VOC family protein [Clostridium]MBD8047928.1 VOC family protein [Clostridium faecium]MBS5824280.1 VOC family protein [Clostridium argentinense]MDU1350029.1 VOC family protein [Clostridium argentinense]
MITMNHVGVTVKDMEASKKFYSEILDGIIDHEYEDENVHLCFIKSGNGVIELVQRKKVESSFNIGVVEHIAFTVENLEDEIEKLKENNVEIISESPRVCDKKLIAFFKGPNGEKLEFVQYL